MTPVASAFDTLIQCVADRIRDSGYKRNRQDLRRLVGGNASIMSFQRSDQSTAQAIVLTVNLGIVVGRLLDPQRDGIDGAKVYDAHFRCRLGSLLPIPTDQWWTLTAATDVEALSTTLVDLLLTLAIPTLHQYESDEALINLWKSGRSPGLTEAQRKRYLVELSRAAS